MNREERDFIRRAALLNLEGEAYATSYDERVDAFYKVCPPQRLVELYEENQQECAAILATIPDAMALKNLDFLIHELSRFSMLPAEDRGYVAISFMQLHEARTLFLKGFLTRATQEASDAGYRLHWVACERKRNNARAQHRMPDPNTLKYLDRVSRRIDIWCRRMDSVEVVADG